ncbi:MAG: hypothetical protein IPL52_17995 [Flavobacteriales bacterium]|nr:hypothetical protein [Flavobacteriales bacterium]
MKMKAVAAVQRKTLVLAYTLWKNNTPYDRQHRAPATDNEKGQPLEAALNELA